MPAFTNLTRSFTNVKRMVDELSQGISGQDLPNAIGLLTCFSEIDFEELVSGLADTLNFPVVGGTTWASPFAPREDEVSASLTVLYGEDIRHSINVSAPLERGGNMHNQMSELYDGCLDRLDGPPKMFLIFIPLAHDMDMSHPYLPCLFELAQDVPVFGGMVSEDFGTGRAAVLAEGRAYNQSAALVAFSGDINPVFAVGSELDTKSVYAPVVTKAENNIVYKVDDMTFCDYLESLNFVPDDSKVHMDWMVSAILEGKSSKIDGRPDICELSYVRTADGSAAFSTTIPVGVKIRLGALTKNNVLKSAEMAMKEINQKVEAQKEEGAKHNVFLAISCLSRYYAQVGDDNLEGEQLKALAPEGLPTFGFYAFKEICPTLNRKNKTFNRTHNESLALCVL